LRDWGKVQGEAIRQKAGVAQYHQEATLCSRKREINTSAVLTKKKAPKGKKEVKAEEKQFLKTGGTKGSKRVRSFQWPIKGIRKKQNDAEAFFPDVGCWKEITKK